MKTLVVSHLNADPDGVCSSFLLSHMLKKTGKASPVDVYFPSLSSISKKVIKEFSLKILQEVRLDSYESIYLVDTNSKTMLGSLAKEIEGFKGKIIVIDHHSFNPSVLGFCNIYLVYSRPSTCEVLHHLFKGNEKFIGEDLATLLLIGILSETNWLRNGDNETVKTVCNLIKRKADIKKAVRVLRKERDESEKIAILKAAQRMEIKRINKWLIVFTTVSSFHGSVCQALIGLGADVAFAGGEKKKMVVISARAKSRFHDETGVHLGRDIMKKIGKMIGGDGGGHATAAGAVGERNLNEALDFIKKEIELLIRGE